MNRVSLRYILLLGGALAATSSASGAFALDAADGPPPSGASTSALDEVVVTARRREENLQTTPVAITAISSETLEARNVVTLAKIAQIAPNFTLYQTTGSLGAAAAFMRGVGYADTVIGQDSPIGIYLDGVAAGRISTAAMDLVGPERVEVLRGPQGTLFGRNTTGGAILITSRTPGDEFGGQVKASYGTYRASSVQARIDTGLLGDSGVKVSAAYQHRQRDGSHDSGLQPRNLDPGSQSGDAFWFKAVGEWGKLTTTLSADYSESSGVPTTAQVVDASAGVRNFVALSPTYGGGSYTFTKTPQYTIANDSTAGEQDIWAQGIALTLNYELSDNLSLKSISALRAYKRRDPVSYGPGDIRGNVGTVASPRIVSFNGLYALDRTQSQRQRSQEIQLLGSAGDFDYVAGVYYFNEDAWDFGRTRFPSVAASGLTATDSISFRQYTVDSKSTAGFAQVDYRPSFFDKKLELSGGIRRTKDTRNFDQTIAIVRSVNLKTSNTSFLASGNYQWTPDVMTYVRFATGYRAGGFNVRSTATTNPIFKPEKIKSWEGGFKIQAWDRRVRLNGAVFNNDYSNLQVPVFQPPGATSSGGSTSINANARYRGFELELEVAPVEGLTLNASVGYVQPKYKNYPKALNVGQVDPGCSPITASNVVVGQDCAATAEFQYFAKTTAGLGVSYLFSPTNYGRWSARADYAYRGQTDWVAFNLSTTPFQKVLAGKAYGLLSARVALSDIPVSSGSTAQIALFGENLTNEKYSAQGIDYGFMATITYADRRTIGIEAKVDF